MGESASGGCGGSWGNGARAKSVNHSISKINGMFWSSLPFVSAEWPVQRQAQQAGAEVSAVVDGYRRIMKQRPGLSATFSSAQPSRSERAGCQTRLLSPTSPEPQRQRNSHAPAVVPSLVELSSSKVFSESVTTGVFHLLTRENLQTPSRTTTNLLRPSSLCEK